VAKCGNIHDIGRNKVNSIEIAGKLGRTYGLSWGWVRGGGRWVGGGGESKQKIAKPEYYLTII
jgi:hypothetical protein